MCVDNRITCRSGPDWGRSVGLEERRAFDSIKFRFTPAIQLGYNVRFCAAVGARGPPPFSLAAGATRFDFIFRLTWCFPSATRPDTLYIHLYKRCRALSVKQSLLTVRSFWPFIWWKELRKWRMRPRLTGVGTLWICISTEHRSLVLLGGSESKVVFLH